MKTSDPSVFTKNTNVVSEYEGVYLLRFANAEETKSAYSYYYGKVGSIEVNKVCFSISTVEETPQETPQETEAPAQEETSFYGGCGSKGSGSRCSGSVRT